MAGTQAAFVSGGVKGMMETLGSRQKDVNVKDEMQKCKTVGQVISERRPQ